MNNMNKILKVLLDPDHPWLYLNTGDKVHVENCYGEVNMVVLYFGSE